MVTLCSFVPNTLCGIAIGLKEIIGNRIIEGTIKQMKEYKVGDKVIYLGIDGKQNIKGIVTYVIRDGSNPPWGYIMVNSPDDTSYICNPDKLVCAEPK